MPIYPDYYYGNLPSIPAYGSGYVNSSLYNTLTGYNRSMNPPSYTPRSTLFSQSRYVPMLTPISESSLLAGRRPLTRMNSPKLSIHSSPKYIAPRPIAINTADIDVSATRFRKRADQIINKKIEPKHCRSSIEKRDINQKEISGDGNTEVISPFSYTDQTHHEKELQQAQPSNRPLTRNRSVVRLSTIRTKSPKKGDIEGRQIVKIIPSEKKAKTSWRENFEEDELTLKAFKEPLKKSPGELLLERHLMKEKDDDKILDDGKTKLYTKIDKKPTVSRRKSTKKKNSVIKAPTFHEICKVISSDQISVDLNASELRGVSFPTKEEQEIHLIQKIRRLSSGNISVVDEPNPSMVAESVKPISQFNNNIPTTVENDQNKSKNDNLQPKVIDASQNKSNIPAKRKDQPLKIKAVVEDEDHTINKIIKLPANGKKKPLIVREKSEDGLDFWGQIASRETVYLNKRKDALIQQKTEMLKSNEKIVNHKETDVDLDSYPKAVDTKFDPIVHPNLGFCSKKDDSNKTKSSIKETLLLTTDDNKLTSFESNLFEHKEIDKKSIQPLNVIISDTNIDPIATNVINLTSDPEFTLKKLVEKETPTCKINEKNKNAETIVNTDILTYEHKSNTQKIAVDSKNIQNKTSSKEKYKENDEAIVLVDKMNENKSDATDIANILPCIEKVTFSNTEKIEVRDQLQTTIKNDHNEVKVELETNNKTNKANQIAQKPKITTIIKHQTENKSDIGNVIVNDHPQKQINTDDEGNKKSGSLSTFPTYANLNDLLTENSIDLSSDRKTLEETLNPDNNLLKQDEPPNIDINNNILSDSEGDDLSCEFSDSDFEMANKKRKNVIRKKRPLIQPLECEDSKKNKTVNNILSTTSDEKSSNINEVKDETPESPSFDPTKMVRFQSKKMKCYTKDEPMVRPVVARPRPLQKKKIIYSSSSESTDESSDTDDEDEDSESGRDSGGGDELSDNKTSPNSNTNDCNANDIRMSTCSVDSGFEGGTAPSSPKQMLGAHDARDSPVTPLSHNPAYRIETNNDGDLETSYTYAQFQRSGRITAPATIIPRFKKYCVDDFHFLTVLGKGSFGKVLLAELKKTEYYYAVKCLKKDVVLEDDDVECTLIERKVLALGTNHPYLCHLFCTFQTDSHLFFVMEYLNGGDLMFHIQQTGRFPEPRARFYAAEIVSGLKFLHKKGIVYRDLKLDNVLLDFDGHVRIADFGMCKLQIYLDKTADSFCGTPDYMAPEIIKGQKYNQTVDWWSFGVLLYEMLIGQSPFSGMDEDELFWSICNEIPWFPVYLTQEALNIVKSLLEKDASIRLGAPFCVLGDITEQPFFRSISWERLDARALEPPFKPQVRHPLDTQYFDKAFTRERVRLTPIDKTILQSMDQQQFQGFSYTNPNATLS